MKLAEIHTTSRDTIRDLKKLDLPDQAAALLANITMAINHLPDISKAMDTREADNAKLRDQLKELEGQLPTGDAVVLTKSDADALTAYRELGQLEDLKLKSAGFDEAVATAKKLKTQAVLDRASRDPNDETTYRFKPSVLDALLKLNDATLVEADNAFTVKAGETSTDLVAWLDSNAGDFAPALEATSVPTARTASKQAGDRTSGQKPSVAPDERIRQRRASSGDYAI